MKSLLKYLLALAMGAVCVALVVKDMDGSATVAALGRVSASGIAIYLATLAVTHFFRAWRWEYLLRPLGIRVPFRELLPISSVGFMAILALPVRLGEFVRPYFIVRLHDVRMSAVLGTVAVERIVDGLMISVLFFGSYVASDASSYSPKLQFAAWLSLLGFSTLTVFLACALRWTEPTIRLALTLTLLHRYAPALAERIADKLRSLIRGFLVLRDARNLVPFLIQSVLYWGSNGFGMWLLARDMGLPISLSAAYATMSFTGVLISLPNSPGLLGQFHLGIVAGLGAYLPTAMVRSSGIAYATILHGLQFVWYVGIGFLAFLAVPRGDRSLRQVVAHSKRAVSEMGDEVRSGPNVPSGTQQAGEVSR